ncbi:MAG: Ig-like domain-containing protein [Planctomycetota bacterium]
MFYRNGIAAVCLGLAACGSGGSSGSSGAGLASYGRIQLLSHDPADTAVQVPLAATIRLRFDAPMVLDCMYDVDTWLRVAGSTTPVPGTFALLDRGQTVTFTPDAPLLAETDYEFQVSPLTCDLDGRLFDETRLFSFRTLDLTAPLVQSSNIVPGQNGRSRTAPLVVTMSEGMAAGSVSESTVVLRDGFGHRYDCVRTLSGGMLTVQPRADLPGDRQMTLQLASSLTDRAGNALGAPWSIQFRTAVDSIAPRALDVWPPTNTNNVTPLVQPVVTFSESMDPTTVEPSSLLFQDEFGSIVAFAVHASSDQRTLRVQPLNPLQVGRTYSLAFLVSAAAVTDVSGNGLQSSLALTFKTGADSTPPAIDAIAPAAGAAHVSVNAAPLLTFTEPMDPTWLTAGTVVLERDGVQVAALVQPQSQTVVRLLPVVPLDPAAAYRVRVRSGHDGVRDTAGNLLTTDFTADFTVTDDATVPNAMLLPPDGGNGVAPGASLTVVFDSRVDPSTVSGASCQLRGDDHTPLAATVTLGNDDRVVTITPSAPLLPGTYYRTWVRGGPDGVREVSGNWLGADLGARFRTGFGADTSPPSVALTVNGLNAARRSGLSVPPSGFSLDVTANDGTQLADMGSVALELTGPAAAPTPARLYRDATVGFDTLRTFVPADEPLAPGDWSVVARVADLSGNVSTSAPVTFTVAQPNGSMVPFERTQVVWARTDLDRDGNGRADFDDDMIRLGLATAADPVGVNATARRLLLDAILSQANQLFLRGTRGEPLGPDSVAIRFTKHEPIALAHMQMALGGFDPEGSRNRAFGDDSTGVLGRAYYDYRNGQTNDRNIATSPGLGVFASEMFLYQARVHLNVYPLFQTMFAQRFLPLCPEMGGVPVGTHAVDATVLAPDFVPALATGEQFARWQVILRAIDDWSIVIGTVLAHEVGHSIGLTAPGPMPTGLFGDSSLHNAASGAAEVMAAAVGYEAMITLQYAFRDVNIAYLRHRILLR